ncbi:hypothetical protein [Chitinilyticum litopenaei]|uniref:hypothetical protein n=1 Tax=Chitinilyticum litopenaei TaxID=1121276 RepID=UPI0004072FE7|nr:hypothetical protein [Chitinilyticum litopenaei]
MRALRRHLLGWLHRHGRRPMAIPVLALLAVGDAIVPALPTQGSVVLLGLLQPARRRLIALAFALAGTAGAALLLTLAATLDLPAQWPHSWAGAQRLLHEHGLLALLVLCALPSPPRSLIVLSALAGLAWPQILLAVARFC